jgi:hypothetical protein
MWSYSIDTSRWTQLPAIPNQSDIAEATDAARTHDRDAVKRR